MQRLSEAHQQGALYRRSLGALSYTLGTVQRVRNWTIDQAAGLAVPVVDYFVSKKKAEAIEIKHRQVTTRIIKNADSLTRALEKSIHEYRGSNNRLLSASFKVTRSVIKSSLTEYLVRTQLVNPVGDAIRRKIEHIALRQGFSWGAHLVEWIVPVLAFRYLYEQDAIETLDSNGTCLNETTYSSDLCLVGGEEHINEITYAMGQSDWQSAALVGTTLKVAGYAASAYTMSEEVRYLKAKGEELKKRMNELKARIEEKHPGWLNFFNTPTGEELPRGGAGEAEEEPPLTEIKKGFTAILGSKILEALVEQNREIKAAVNYLNSEGPSFSETNPYLSSLLGNILTSSSTWATETCLDIGLGGLVDGHEVPTILSLEVIEWFLDHEDTLVSYATTAATAAIQTQKMLGLTASILQTGSHAALTSVGNFLNRSYQDTANQLNTCNQRAYSFYQQTILKKVAAFKECIARYRALVTELIEARSQKKESSAIEAELQAIKLEIDSSRVALDEARVEYDQLRRRAATFETQLTTQFGRELASDPEQLMDPAPAPYLTGTLSTAGLMEESADTLRRRRRLVQPVLDTHALGAEKTMRPNSREIEQLSLELNRIITRSESDLRSCETQLRRSQELESWAGAATRWYSSWFTSAESRAASGQDESKEVVRAAAAADNKESGSRSRSGGSSDSSSSTPKSKAELQAQLRNLEKSLLHIKRNLEQAQYELRVSRGDVTEENRWMTAIARAKRATRAPKEITESIEALTQSVSSLEKRRLTLIKKIETSS